MANYDNEDGVWRTIGGRRIFIKDGEDIASAMKKSGKFKSAKKKVKEPDYDKRPQSDVDRENERNNKITEKIEKGMKDFDPNDFEKWRKEVDPDYEMDDDKARARYEAYKDTNVRNQSNKSDLASENDKQLKEKYMNIPERERAQAYADGKNWKDLVKEKDLASDRSKQYSDIEKASGLKVERSFQTDAYGNGDEDHFELSDGRTVVHSRESLGKKEDSWSIEEVKNGSINSQNFKSYDEMIDHLKGGSGSSKVDKVAERLGLKQSNNKMDSEKPRLSKSDKRTIEELDADYYGVPSEYRTEKMTSEWNESRNSAYKKAFEDYKKKHPNTKLTLNKFIDMSEGN